MSETYYWGINYRPYVPTGTWRIDDDEIIGNQTSTSTANEQKRWVYKYPSASLKARTKTTTAELQRELCLPKMDVTMSASNASLEFAPVKFFPTSFSFLKKHDRRKHAAEVGLFLPLAAVMLSS